MNNKINYMQLTAIFNGSSCSAGTMVYQHLTFLMGDEERTETAI
jgi:hypothetical protein